MCLRIWSNLQRFGLVLVFLLLFTMVANAYTVVMRGGRRVEIPAQFVVTNSTVTYEVSPGIQITMQLAAIDVSATERANGEAPGAFFKHAPSNSPASPSPVGRLTAKRTITNHDLESTAQRRRASEIAYENRRKELGLPSVAESRRRSAQDSILFAAELHQLRAQQTDEERYWRDRASALRTEIAAVDGELDVVRRQLDDWNSRNSSSTLGSFTTITSAYPWGIGGNHRRGRRVGSYYPTPGVIFPQDPGYGGIPVARPGWPPFGSPWQYDASYERSTLVNRMNELTGTRAALNARWRELENEARRAGAQPGWLRP